MISLKAAHFVSTFRFPSGPPIPPIKIRSAMTSNKPPLSFFIVPDDKRDYESSIKLGNVIYDVTKPHLVLLQPDGASPPLAPPFGKLHEKMLRNYLIEKEDNMSSKYGLFAKVLDFFGLGINMSHTRGIEASERYEIKTITFKNLDPSREFLVNLEKQGAIMDILKDGEPPCAFLITGTVLATGVVFKSSHAQDRDYDGSLGVSAGGVSVGPSGKRSKKRALKIDWECEEPMMLAFKAQKLQLKNGKFTAEDETEGAYFGDDEKPIQYEVDFDAELSEWDVEQLGGEVVEDELVEGSCKLYLPRE